MDIQEALKKSPRVQIGYQSSRTAKLDVGGKHLRWDNGNLVTYKELVSCGWVPALCDCKICSGLRYLNNKQFTDAQVTVSIEALGNNARCLNE